VVSIPIVNFWNLIAGIMEVGAEVVEAKEEDEDEEEKKEKKKKEKEKETQMQTQTQTETETEKETEKEKEKEKQIPLLPCLVQICYGEQNQVQEMQRLHARVDLTGRSMWAVQKQNVTGVKTTIPMSTPHMASRANLIHDRSRRDPLSRSES